jgi:hypothetical protein
MTALERALARECDAAVGGDARASGAGELARRVQRTPSAACDDCERARLLRLAAVHHQRARSLLALADQYTEAVWDGMPRPRRFFCRHRGFGTADDRRALPAYRALFLRVALAAAERACELADAASPVAGAASLECCSLRVCILWALTAHKERDGAGWCVQLLRACQAGLAPGCGDQHEQELAALYGDRAACAAPASARRALIAAVEVTARKLVRAREAQEQLDTPYREPATQPWCAPWLGLQP